MNHSRPSRKLGIKTLLTHKKFRFHRIIAVLILSAVILVTALSVLNRPIIDKAVVKKADFTVYTPRQSPEGYKLDPEAVKLDQGTLSYVFSSKNADKSITVTVQPTPAGFNMAQMIDKGSIQSTAVSNGTLYNLSAGGSSQYLLDTGDSLVFLTSPADIDTVTINSLVESLVRHDNN